MKYAIEMGSFVMIYIPSFINSCSGIQNDAQIYRQTGDQIRLFLFFQNKRK
jgi:hypothetical protein